MNKYDERGTIGLGILAGLSALQVLIGFIIFVSGLASGTAGVAVLGLMWGLWSFLWTAIWYKWGKKKDAEIELNKRLLWRMKRGAADFDTEGDIT